MSMVKCQCYFWTSHNCKRDLFCIHQKSIKASSRLRICSGTSESSFVAYYTVLERSLLMGFMFKHVMLQ